MRTRKLGINHIPGGMRADSSCKRVCQMKNATRIRTEITSGARTLAVSHPTVGACDREKIKRTIEAAMNPV